MEEHCYVLELRYSLARPMLLQIVVCASPYSLEILMFDVNASVSSS
jgi:hypothetical protein